MDPDNEALNPIDPPENTGGGTTAAEPDLTAGEEALAIDPPDNTGGG